MDDRGALKKKPKELTGSFPRPFAREKRMHRRQGQTKTKMSRRSLPLGALVLFLAGAPVFGELPPLPSEGPSGNLLLRVSSLPQDRQAALQASLGQLQVAPEHAFLDLRSGRWGTLLLSQPVLPGGTDGAAGKTLGRPSASWRQAGPAEAWDGLRGFLERYQEALRIRPQELGSAGDVASHGAGEVFQIHAPRIFEGIPVEGSYLTAVINHGNLVLLGTRRWGDINTSLEPAISGDQAAAALDEGQVGIPVQAPTLSLVPQPQDGPQGPTYGHRLAWKIRTDSAYEALVDAHSGELLSLEHRSRGVNPASVVGGVYPSSSDGVGASGTEQPQWPMPYAWVRDGFSDEFVQADSSGNLPACLLGPFRFDHFGGLPSLWATDGDCSHLSETFPGPLLDLGDGPGMDCDPPPDRANGTSHAVRTANYELHRLRESILGQLPGNSLLEFRRGGLLSRRIIARLNRATAPVCNETFGCCYAQVFRDDIENEFLVCEPSSATRANPGEIASVLDHELGHILDANDLTADFSSPSEGIADAYAALRQNESCIGRGLFSANCGGYGDPCTGCTGFRDIDWQAHASGLPHDLAFIDAACPASTEENGPCGGSAHCEGIVVAEAIWDLYRRDLQGPPFDLLPATALELATRLTYLGAGSVGDWFQCSDGTGMGDGCNADSGYLNLLAIDDDNGDLTDGTPHMTAIFSAFDRHGIACAAPAPLDSGCAGTPTVRPVVTGTPFHRGARLSWAPVPGASSYEVFRAEGVSQCAFGKIKLAEVEGTSYFDSGLANGREHSYTVIPKGPGLSCFGPASACTTVTPGDGAMVELVAGSQDLIPTSGDGDRFLDNCESANLTFELNNSGTLPLTSLRIVEASSPSHPFFEVLASLPLEIAPNQAPCALRTATVPIRSGGLRHDEVLEIVLEITSDELFPTTIPLSLSLEDVESDFEAKASHTFSFEEGLEGWESSEGLFRRVTGGGGNATNAHIEAAPFGRQRCDRLKSPLLRLTETSTLSLWNNFDITPPNTAIRRIYDHANFHFIAGEQYLNQPSGVSTGRDFYQAGANGSASLWQCNWRQNGWAGSFPTWADTSFSSVRLRADDLAGMDVQMEMIYGQNRANQRRGFSFDEVTFTDFELQVPDTQSDNSCPGPIFVDGFESGDTSSWSAAAP